MKKYMILALLSATMFLSQPAKAQDKLLEVVGALSATALYDTYLVIGTLGDGWTKDLYESDHMILLLDEQIALCYSTAEQLELLESSGELLDEADRVFVLQIIGIFDGLADQAALLSDYVYSGLQEDADEFEVVRLENWSNISAVLGIGE
jgi:hypothetical protein